MNLLRQQMIEQLSLFGFSAHTKRNYIEAVGQFSRYHGKSPDKLGEQDIKNFLLYSQRRGLASSSLRILRCGIAFFFTHVLLNPKEIQHIPSLKREKKLPTVLSTSEMERILSTVTKVKHKTVIMVFYATGMRLSELLNFKIEHIDSSRMMLKIVGKGSKERYVALSKTLLNQLRCYWKEYRPTSFLFINSQGKPYSRRTIANIIDEAKELAHITKPGGPHMLRHTYATHLYEAGVAIEVIQRLLGHVNIKTTMKYVYIAQDNITSVKSPLDLLSIDKIMEVNHD